MNEPKDILEHALKLKPAEKFMLIEGLLTSLDEPDKTIDRIWAVEAEKRLKAYKEGKLETFTINDEREDWLRTSLKGLGAAYDDDEIEYSLDLIKEPNPDYEGR